MRENFFVLDITSGEFFDKVHGCLADVAVGDAMGMPASSYFP